MGEIFLGKNEFKLRIDGVLGLPFAFLEGNSERELQSIIFNTLGCEAFNKGFDGGFKFYTFKQDNNLWGAKILLVDLQVLTLTNKEKIASMRKKMKSLYKEIWQ